MRPYQFEWVANLGETSDESALVLSHPVLEIIRMAGIKHAPAAMQHVGPERHRVGLGKEQSFDKLRTNGVGLWSGISIPML